MGGEGSGHRALLADGTVVHLRTLGRDDRAAVADLHRTMPPVDRYLRFFTLPGADAEAVADMIVADDAVAVGAFDGGRLLGVAHYRPEPDGSDPEFAVAVAHEDQHHGVASLLLEQLVDRARAAGTPRLKADVLDLNHAMLRVLRDSGLAVGSIPEYDVRHVVLHLPTGTGPRTERYADAVLDRAGHADAASLRPVLAPRSVAVIGAGRDPGSVGRLLLRDIVDGGFTGAVHVVHPHAATVAGLPCHRSVADLPPGVDLAVLCVPAAAVADVAEQCGRHGVRALLVITAGVRGGALAAVLERHGMRLVGPGCPGIVATDPQVRLQATLARPASAGTVGVAVQSGGVLVALTTELTRLGLGVSTAVSTGDAADVNGDDLLLWWAQDGCTEAAVLHVGSLRRPRQFARLARRLARRIPVLTLRPGESGIGRAATPGAGTAIPRVVRDALLAQAGVAAVDDLTDLAGLLALLRWQPLPAGPRVAILANAGGLGVLAADACTRHGLDVAALAPATRDALAGLLPATATLDGPVEATATTGPEAFGRAVEVLLRDPGVDAVLAVAVPTAAHDPADGLGRITHPGKPVVAVRPGQPESVRRLQQAPGGPVPDPSAVPSFADPSVAGRALAAAARRAAWLARPARPARDPRGVDARRARAVLDAVPATGDGRWLDPARAADLAAAAGLPLVPTTVVHRTEDAVRTWRAHGGPVAVTADVAGSAPQSRAGAGHTGLDSRHRIVAAVRDLRSRFGTRLRGIVVQPMAPAGTELLAGVTADPLCGPLLTLGLGGSDVVDDRSHCLVPATDADLDDLVDGLRASPRLFGPPPGGPAAAAQRARLRAAVRDVAARLAWLADRHPEVAEIEIDPLVLAPGGPVGVGLRIRVAPAHPVDPWLRVLPT